MDHQASSLEEVDIDYITATSPEKSASSSFVDFGRWLVSEEVAKGCKRSQYRAQGYRGNHAGCAAYGISRQGSIIRLSSTSAAEYWSSVTNLARNVTRLDCQVTIRPSVGPTATLREHHKQLLKAPRQRGKPVQFKMWYGPSGPEAAVIGKRVSDRFIRVYDKGLESGEERYQGCLRYEVELHREVALREALRLDESGNVRLSIFEFVRALVAIRGLRLNDWESARTALDIISDKSGVGDEETSSWRQLSEDYRALARPLEKTPAEVNRVVRWLTIGVSPSVARLVQAGQLELVLKALGLKGHVQVVQPVESDTWTSFNKWRQ